jgi:hypothetical protein
MSSINHRRSTRQPSVVKKLTVRIGGTDGTILVFRDRLARALLFLIEADKAGFAPSDWPCEVWSQCIPMLRQEGVGIETVLERTDGLRGRYILRCPVEIIDREDYE